MKPAFEGSQALPYPQDEEAFVLPPPHLSHCHRLLPHLNPLEERSGPGVWNSGSQLFLLWALLCDSRQLSGINCTLGFQAVFKL